MDTYTYELITDQPSKNAKFLNTGKVCEMYEIKKPLGIVCYDITPIGGYVAMDQREGKIYIRIHIPLAYQPSAKETEPFAMSSVATARRLEKPHCHSSSRYAAGDGWTYVKELVLPESCTTPASSRIFQPVQAAADVSSALR